MAELARRAAQREPSGTQRTDVDHVVDQSVEKSDVAADTIDRRGGVEPLARSELRAHELDLERDGRERVSQIVYELRELVVAGLRGGQRTMLTGSPREHHAPHENTLCDRRATRL